MLKESIKVNNMSEKYKYIPEIQAETLEQHKEGVEQQLKKIQLLFCDQVYQQYKKECLDDNKPVKKTFSDILEDHHAYYTEDFRKLVRISSDKDLSLEEQYDLVLAKYYKEIDDMYDLLPQGENDFSSSAMVKRRTEEVRCIFKYIEDEKIKIKDAHPEAWSEANERLQNQADKSQHRVGIIDYNQLKKHVNPEARKAEQLLKEEGFDKYDDFLEIHMPSIFEVESALGSDLIKSSLAGLAEKIIDKIPETRAVVAVSWLLDHPIFKRFIKMKIIGEGGGNWRQLINKDGQIDQTRIEKLFSTGKLPFRNLIGYIDVEEFLKKYLPKHRRGEVRLKEIDKNLNSDKIDIENSFKAEGRAFSEAWDAGELDTKEKVQKYLRVLKSMRGVMEQLGFYERFEKMMTDNIGRDREEINTENREMISEFEIVYNNFIDKMNASKYVEKVVVID